METIPHMKTIQMIAIALVVTLLGGMTGWYVYLKTKQTAIIKTDQLRGSSHTVSQGSNVIPFGVPQISQPNENSATAGANNHIVTHAPQRLWHIDAQPIAGMGFASSTLVYVLRANGNVVVADLTVQNTRRITDTLFPKIYDASIADDGGVLERSIDARGVTTLFVGDIATTSPTASDATTSSQTILRGSYTTPNTISVVLNPFTKKFLYTQTNTAGGVDVYIQGWDEVKGTLLASLPLRGWRPYIAIDGRMFLTQNPADGVEGYTYLLSPKGVLSTYLRNIPGLMTVPEPFGKGILYSSSSGGNVSLVVATSSTGLLTPISTIAEKCVWAPGKSQTVYCAVPKTITSTSFVNQWYQGTIHTNDEWWQIDTSTSTRIYDPAHDNNSFDVERPMIDPSGNYLVFRNRIDQSLWALRVSQ